MSSPIWTPAALSSEARPYAGPAWRLVEAQHRVSTLKLVDSLHEQQVLETLLEATKPPLPAPCQHLDYLLSTPFRYRPYPQGSRFRRAGLTPGVWYGAERAETALAEIAFYRMLFYAESPATPFPDDASEFTGFAVPLATPQALDLTAGALARDSALWLHPVDYAACQQLAEDARASGATLIRYQSLRDPAGGANLAVLDCSAFASPAPTERQSWHLRISRNGVQALREHPRLGLEFPPGAFASDPRLADMIWDRPTPR